MDIKLLEGTLTFYYFQFPPSVLTSWWINESVSW
jgi:hypothetical protein